jgi:hypothetical protein
LVLALQPEVPALGGFGRHTLKFLLGAKLALLIPDRRPRLPKPAIATLINLDLSAQQIDGRHDTPLAHLRCG